MAALLGAQTCNPAPVSYPGVTYPDCLSIQAKSSFSNNCQAKELDQLPAYLPGRKFRDFMPVEIHCVIASFEPAFILIGCK